jgi:dTDP-4-dehydrorhamnose reductase
VSYPRPILVTGANGQLGSELKRRAWPTGYEVVALGRAELDLADRDAIAAMVASRTWAAVINGAAYTAVDKAESDLVNAWIVNSQAPAVFAEACAKLKIPLIQVSTDYVFAGDKQGAWETDDPVAPLSVYGASKLAGELAVRFSGARHAVIRTAWVVSTHGNNFVKTMLRVAASRHSLSVVDDQYGSPTSAADLAEALMAIAIRLAEDENAPTGIFHFSNAGKTSWAGFAQEIFAQSRQRGGVSADVVPIPSTDYPTPAKRPANSMLSHSAISEAYGIEPRDWHAALGDILDELIGAVK